MIDTQERINMDSHINSRGKYRFVNTERNLQKCPLYAGFIVLIKNLKKHTSL